MYKVNSTIKKKLPPRYYKGPYHNQDDRLNSRYLRRYISNPHAFVSDGGGIANVPSSSSLSEGPGGALAGEPTTPRSAIGGQQSTAKDSKSRAAAYDSKMRQKVQFAQQVRICKLYYVIRLSTRCMCSSVSAQCAPCDPPCCC